MKHKVLGAVAAALLGVSMLTAGSLAQDATPAPSTGDCAPGSAEENLQIVQRYLDAVLSGDSETADALLSDDFNTNLSVEGAEVPNEPGNADELANLGIVAESNVQVTHSIAQGDWVAVYFNFDVRAENVEGATEGMTSNINAMAMFRIDCGMIAEGLFEFDALELLQELGFEIMPAGGE